MILLRTLRLRGSTSYQQVATARVLEEEQARERAQSAAEEAVRSAEEAEQACASAHAPCAQKCAWGCRI